jgi:alpha-beta hydrolase superfamily lysophospholipase
MNDDLCGFIFTTNGYYNLFDGLLQLSDKENTLPFPQNLPILIVSGSMDPVGGFEAGIKKVYDSFKNKGVTNITLNIYKDSRHEVLNEINREEVYQDIYRWMTNNKET